METKTFGEHLNQFSESVDQVTEDTFRSVMELIAIYANTKLGFRYFEFMIPQKVNGYDGLASAYSYLDGKSQGNQYSTELFQRKEEPKPQTHSALAYDVKRPLWVVSKTKRVLSACDDYENRWSEHQWSQKIILPEYKPVDGLAATTSVIIPVSRNTQLFGVVDFEGDKYIQSTKAAEEELCKIAGCVARLWFLYQAYDAQSKGTKEALGYLRGILSSRTLRDVGIPKLFLAYSSKAKPDVLTIMKATLDEFAGRIEIVDWSKLDKLGPIVPELCDQIGGCRFGICYLSEEIPGKSNRFRDNLNVLFEAGMLYALTNQPGGRQSGWIPIREAESPPAPFDFAQMRKIEIQRDKNGNILDAKETVTDLLHSMLDGLLGTP